MAAAQAWAGRAFVRPPYPNLDNLSVIATPAVLTTPAPAVTGLQSDCRPPAGGATVTITGSNFTNAKDVTFGDQVATHAHVLSSSQLTAVDPAGTGTVDVHVITPSGISTTSSADLFAYTSKVAFTGAPTNTAAGVAMSPVLLG